LKELEKLRQRKWKGRLAAARPPNVKKTLFTVRDTLPYYAEHVPSDGTQGREVIHQADELPSIIRSSNGLTLSVTESACAPLL